MGLLGDFLDYINPMTWVNAYSGRSAVKAQEQANEFNLQATRETNELNKELYYDQKDENRFLREQEMEYDSAGAQVQRFKDAGLNPILAMYQGVNAGSVGASSAPSPSPMQSPHMNPVDYSPMANAIGNTMSLLAMINPVAESFALAKGANSRASSVTNSAHYKSVLDGINVDLAKDEHDINQVQKHIVNEQLKQEQFKTTMADIYNKVLVKNQSAFEESLLAEWQAKVEGKKLTHQQALTEFERTLAQKLENEGLGATKKELWSIVHEFTKAHIGELLKIAKKLGSKSASIWKWLPF